MEKQWTVPLDGVEHQMDGSPVTSTSAASRWETAPGAWE